MISLIVAYDLNQGIGYKNTLPWKLTDDLRFFKKQTLNKPIIMGRTTFDSIGKPLPNRRNIVLTRQEDLQIHGCEVFHNIKDALTACKDEPEIMIIGGANIYSQSLGLVNRMYISTVDTQIKADAYFPVWNKDGWSLQAVERFTKNERNQFDFKVETWDKT
jgi:dihydrofolate reductase